MKVANHTSNKNRILKATVFLIVTVALLFSLTYVKEIPLMQEYIDQQQVSVQSIAKKLNTIIQETVVPGSTNTDEISVSGGTPGVKGCGLTLRATSNTGTVTSNTELSTTLVIKNEGKSQCNQASISVFYSGNQTFISSTPKPTSSNYYWKFGNLKPGASRTILLKTKYVENEDPALNTEFCLTANNSSDVCALLEFNTDETVVTEPPTPIDVEDFDPSSSEYGVWVWTSPYEMTSTERNSVIASASASNFNVIYLTIDDYLSIDALDEGPAKEAQKVAYSNALESFIIAANAKGIDVDVEAGWRDWAESGNTYKGDAIIDYAIEYNNSHSNKIRGVQFDVEPYLLPSYESNKAAVLKNFVAFVDQSTSRIGSSSLRLSIVIPHFYDSAQKWTPAVTHDGITTYTFDHLLRILDSRKNSSIILMSYRNFAENDNGSIEISEVEVNTAVNHPTKIIVAQETGNVEPDYVTFYGKSKSYLENQIALINQAFKAKNSFGGIAIHYLEPYLEL